MGITPAAAYPRTSGLTMNDFSDGALFCSHGTPTKNEDEDCYVDSREYYFSITNKCLSHL